ncbi:Tryptophan--tRNA ligase, mitochondrial [Puccinia graminis f. sp. tritici]|uniref:Tryptophan--tRNA ligase, mitochondrial n=1 Tax=Puccinia graminis f. sp. tritici TaxID=56615 RepID=A0A5B0LGA8_PUCGR|nr:Tryptophan--tRNA ligase, mitochondrial [Puccinia graminis f. sp. tritici]
MTTWKSQIATSKNSNSLSEVDDSMLHHWVSWHSRPYNQQTSYYTNQLSPRCNLLDIYQSISGQELEQSRDDSKTSRVVDLKSELSSSSSNNFRPFNAEFSRS